MKYALSFVIPLPFTSRFVNQNGRHWWVWWVQWRNRILLRGGHREDCCRSGTCAGSEASP